MEHTDLIELARLAKKGDKVAFSKLIKIFIIIILNIEVFFSSQSLY
ncbi:hypothetical protein [Clostridium sp. Marseille-Q2269]|nr:hypothetical protein [Clostridium sp. Marseille-Q2269]